MELPSVVLGAMAFSRADADTRIRVIHAALDAGVTAIDTAPLYELGESERIVGRALADRKGRAKIFTKVGLRWDGEHGEVLVRVGDAVVRRDSRPASVRRDVEDSLRRLGVERIDLCQVHHPDRDTPIGETMGELSRLRDEGKIDAVGVSNFGAAEIREAARTLGEVPLATYQGRYSLLARQAEREVWPVLEETGSAFMAYSPLAMGVLAGRRRGGLSGDDWRAYDPLFWPSNAAAIERAALVLDELAAAHGVSAARLALAWVLARRGADAVVVGASRPEQIRDAAEAASLPPDDEALARLTEAFAAVRIDRSPPPSRKRDRIRALGGRLVAAARRRVSSPRR